MPSFVYAPAVLLLWLGVLRALAPEARGEQPWESRRDLPLAALAGAWVAIMTGLWLPRFHMTGWPTTSSDFYQFCETVGSLQHGSVEDVNWQRSAGAGILPSLLARHFGVLGGLALGALVAQFGLGAAVYLWARAVHGRFAGIAAATLAPTLAPLVILARTSSFYPEQVAGLALCAAGTAAAARWRTLPALAALGTGAGVALAMDLRAVVAALVALGVAAVVIPFAPWRWWPARLAVVVAPLGLSWAAIAPLVDFKTTGLVFQVSAFISEARHQAGLPRIDFRLQSANDFVWGRGSPLDIIESLRKSTELMAFAPEPALGGDLVPQVLPWIWPLAVAGALAVAGSVRKPWAFLALLAPLLPYLAALRGSFLVLPAPRHLGIVTSAIPVLLGVAVATVAAVALGASGGARWRLIAATGLLLALVTGTVPSWLSPVAPWRRAWSSEEFPRAFEQGIADWAGTDRKCRAYVDEDAREGRTWPGFRR